MTDDNTVHDYAALFDLPDSHSLKVSSTKTVKKDSVVCEIRWLNEHDDNRQLIARFRTWISRSLSPPYRRQTGWERYSPSGSLLDREVRYSKRDNMDYLH